MRRLTSLITVAILAAAFIAYQGWRWWTSSGPPQTVASTVPTGDVPVVMRTKGGWLEVARVAHNRSYDLTKDGSFLGMVIPYCKTRAIVSFRAFYTYRIPLAVDWPATVTRQGRFEVTAPRPVPSLPVAFDSGTLRKQFDGCWLAGRRANLDELERRITGRLAAEARSDRYTNLALPAAKRTVAEFVGKWLVAQRKYEIAKTYPIDVTFAP